MAEPASNELIALTADIVASHVSYNIVASADLPTLISTVFGALSKLGAPQPVPAPQILTPAVPVRASVRPDHLVCLEDGQKLTMLKRYLARKYDMTPEQYRAKWNLPASYPMVAPDYAERRRVLAKESGLGRKPAEPAIAAPAPKPRARKLKVAFAEG